MMNGRDIMNVTGLLVGTKTVQYRTQFPLNSVWEKCGNTLLQSPSPPSPAAGCGGVHILGLQQPHEVLVEGAGLQVVTNNPHLEDPTPLLVSDHLVLRYLFVEEAQLEGEGRGERGREKRGGERREGEGGIGRKGEGRGGEWRGE